jgi:hypothetical protein
MKSKLIVLENDRFDMIKSGINVSIWAALFERAFVGTKMRMMETALQTTPKRNTVVLSRVIFLA